MSIVVALTIGLVLWIVAWSLDIKAFDAFMVTIAIVLIAVTHKMIMPFVNQLLGRETAAEQQTPPGV